MAASARCSGAGSARGDLFADADPTFAALEHLSSVLITRPTNDDEYQDRVRQGSGIEGVSLATVPLLSGHTTTGTLGFIKFGDREWHHDEINALRAVAALLAQLQARVAAEERLTVPGVSRRADLAGDPPRIDRSPRPSGSARRRPGRSP